MPNPVINKKIVLSGTALLPETQQWLAVLSTRPNTLIVNSVNTFIKSAKADGNWQLLDRFWLFGQDIQANALVSIVNPTSTQITEVASPTFTANQGYDFNGTTQYLRTAYIPSSSAVNYSLNSASFGVYCTENFNGAFAWDMGCANAVNGASLSLRDGTNSAYAKTNQAIATLITVGSVTDSRGFWVSIRTASNAIAIARNGSNIGTDTDVSGALPTTEMYIGALNNNGVAAAFSQRKVAIAFSGSGTINQSTLYTSIQTLATSIGFNV